MNSATYTPMNDPSCDFETASQPQPRQICQSRGARGFTSHCRLQGAIQVREEKKGRWQKDNPCPCDRFRAADPCRGNLGASSPAHTRVPCCIEPRRELRVQRLLGRELGSFGPVSGLCVCHSVVVAGDELASLWCLVEWSVNASAWSRSGHEKR